MSTTQKTTSPASSKSATTANQKVETNKTAASTKNKVLLKNGITTLEPDKEANKQLALEDKIKLFERKNELIQRLYKFKETKTKLLAVQEDKSNIDFDNSNQIKMTLTRGYRDELLAISNEFIIEELIKLIINKIDQKTEELEIEIEA